MPQSDYILTISFAGKLNVDLVDIHADNRFDKQNYYAGVPLFNTKHIIVNDQPIKLTLAAFPPNLQRAQLANYSASSANIFCFDKNDSESFIFAQHLYSLYREKYPKRSNPNAFISVITDDNETVSTEEGQQVAANLNMMYYELNLSDRPKMHTILVELTQLYLGEK